MINKLHVFWSVFLGDLAEGSPKPIKKAYGDVALPDDLLLKKYLNWFIKPEMRSKCY
jgi:hypothetical protein